MKFGAHPTYSTLEIKKVAALSWMY